MLCHEAFRYSQSLLTELHIYVFFCSIPIVSSGHWLLGWLVKIFLVESLCKCGMIRFS